MRVRRHWLIGLVVLGMLAAACGGSDDDGSADTSATTGGTAGSSDTTTAAAQVDRTATVRFWNSQPPPGWDPHHPTNFVLAFQYLTPVYDRLVKLSAHDEIEPMLATDWTFSPDGRTLTMTLRDDVTFQDGEAFDADVVVANMRRAKADGSGVASNLANVETVVANSPTEVAFTLKQADQTILFQLASLPGMMISPAGLTASDLATNPSGSGAYELQSQDATTAVYVRNDDYWDPDAAPAARKEIAGVVDPQARLNAIQSGQTDVITVTGDIAAQARTLAESGDYQFVTYNSTAVYLFYMNDKIAPFDDPNVRKAVDMAIDRTAIQQAVLGGDGDPAGQVFPPEFIGHLDDVDPKYDPDEARRLIQAAGVDGVHVSVLVANANVYPRMAEVLQQQLADVGINLDLDVVDSVQSRQEWRAGGHAGLVLGGFQQSPDPSASMGLYTGADNPGDIDPQLQSMADAARVLPIGSDERTQAYEEINQYIVDHPVHAILNWFPTNYLARTNVVGVDDLPMSSVLNVPDTAALAIAAD